MIGATTFDVRDYEVHQLPKRVKWMAVIAVIMMYLVLISGALVTNTDSGRGCGNRWPLCDTEYWDAAAIIEFFAHRGLTGLATISVLALCYLAWKHMTRRPIVTRLIWLSIGFLILQALLGAGNVMWPQPKLILALHFGISLVSFASVLLLAVWVFRESADRQVRLPDVPDKFRRWAWMLTGFVFVIVYLGAYIRHTGAGLACTGWPLCNGQVIPPLASPAGVNFLHRVAAGVGFLMALRAVWLVAPLEGRPDVQRATWASFLLMTLQVLSGALLPSGFYAIWSQMLHSALLVALFGVLSYLSLIVVPSGASFFAPTSSGRVATTRL